MRSPSCTARETCGSGRARPRRTGRLRARRPAVGVPGHRRSRGPGRRRGGPHDVHRCSGVADPRRRAHGGGRPGPRRGAQTPPGRRAVPARPRAGRGSRLDRGRPDAAGHGGGTQSARPPPAGPGSCWGPTSGCSPRARPGRTRPGRTGARSRSRVRRSRRRRARPPSGRACRRPPVGRRGRLPREVWPAAALVLLGGWSVRAVRRRRRAARLAPGTGG
jgi:hypothetical protein